MQLFSVETFFSRPESLFSPLTLKLVITACVLGWGLQLWFTIDAKLYRFQRFRVRRNRVRPKVTCDLGVPWPELETLAQAVIDKVWTKFPPEILTEVSSIPLLFRAEHKRGGSGLRTLGEYQGFTAGVVSEQKGPIVFYLRNIEQICVENGDDFANQVCATYLHELGHHFGWSEQDVEARGL